MMQHRAYNSIYLAPCQYMQVCVSTSMITISVWPFRVPSKQVCHKEQYLLFVRLQFSE